jgi:uncharacterized protein (DUF2336 family)
MLEGMTPPKNRAVYCRVDQLLADMTPEDKKILIDALANTSAWSANALSTALRQRGVSVADTTIAKHRSQACACYRD